MQRFCPDNLAAKSVQEIFHAVQVSGQTTGFGTGDVYIPESTAWNLYDLNGNPVYSDHPSSPSPVHGVFDQDGNLYVSKPGNAGMEIAKLPPNPDFNFLAAQANRAGADNPEVPVANFANNIIANDPRVVDIATGIATAANLTVSYATVKTNEVLVVCVARHSGIDLEFTVAHAGTNLTVDETQDNGALRLSVTSYKPAQEASGAITVTLTDASGTVSAVAFKIIQLASSAIDAVADDSGTSTTPNSTAAGATTVAKEVVVGAVGTRGPLSDDAGTWGASLLAHQRAGTEEGVAASNSTIATAYRVVYKTGSFTASKSGITSRAWCAICATYK